jgi:hypothetical protein
MEKAIKKKIEGFTGLHGQKLAANKKFALNSANGLTYTNFNCKASDKFANWFALLENCANPHTRCQTSQTCFK